MTDFLSHIIEPQEEGAFDGIHCHEGEFVALIRHDEGYESRVSYLTRDFLETARDAHSLYEHAAEELSAATEREFLHQFVHIGKINYLAHRTDGQLHYLSFHDKHGGPIERPFTEFQFTLDELNDIYSVAKTLQAEFKKSGDLDLPKYKHAMTCNINVLHNAASTTEQKPPPPAP